MYPAPINVVSPGAPHTIEPDGAPIVTVLPAVETETAPLPCTVTASCAVPLMLLTTCPEAILPAVTALLWM